MTRFKIRHEGIRGNQHEPRRLPGFPFIDQRAAATHQPFLRNAKQIAAALFNIGTGFADIFQLTSISEVRFSGNTETFSRLAISFPPDKPPISDGGIYPIIIQMQRIARTVEKNDFNEPIGLVFALSK